MPSQTINDKRPMSALTSRDASHVAVDPVVENIRLLDRSFPMELAVESVSIMICSDMQANLALPNLAAREKVCPAVFSEKSYPLRSDQSLHEPSHNAVRRFIKDVLTRLEVKQVAVVIHAVTYMEKLILRGQMIILPHTWRRFVLIAIIFAIKYFEDENLWNVDAVKCLRKHHLCPTLSLQDLNRFESKCLEILGFNLWVSPQQYTTYVKGLKTILELYQQRIQRVKEQQQEAAAVKAPPKPTRRSSHGNLQSNPDARPTLGNSHRRQSVVLPSTQHHNTRASPNTLPEDFELEKSLSQVSNAPKNAPAKPNSYSRSSSRNSLPSLKEGNNNNTTTRNNNNANRCVAASARWMNSTNRPNNMVSHNQRVVPTI